MSNLDLIKKAQHFVHRKRAFKLLNSVVVVDPDWIRIRIGSVFRSFLDPDPEYGSGSTHANIG